MSKKFEKLIELIIAEEKDKARDLFHEIVVERSRDIYESLIENEDLDDDMGGDQIDDMIDDIEADEETSVDDDDDDDDDVNFGEEPDSEELEDRVVDLEDALDELRNEFRDLMGDDDAGDSDDLDDLDMDSEFDDDSDMDMDVSDDDDDEVDFEFGSDDSDVKNESRYSERNRSNSRRPVREFTEKTPAPVTSEPADVNTTSPLKAKGNLEKPNRKAVDPTHGGEEKGRKVANPPKQTKAMSPQEAGKAGLRSAPKPQLKPTN